MKKTKKWVVGNWKMNPQLLSDAKLLVRDVKRLTKGVKRTNIVFCPPFVYLSPLSAIGSNSIFLGAQNAHPAAVGPYTGEVSITELPQFSVSHVIVGHSERRAIGENDDMVAKKTTAVLGEGLSAIVCVGEAFRDHSGDHFAFVRHQLIAALRDVSKKLSSHLLIAYEPIWAIGGTGAMQPRDVHEMSIFIRKTLQEMFGVLAADIPILYGGSVDASNAADIVRDGFVQGLLVGGQSLKAKNFAEIIIAVDSVK